MDNGVSSVFVQGFPPEADPPSVSSDGGQGFKGSKVQRFQVSCSWFQVEWRAPRMPAALTTRHRTCGSMSRPVR